MAASIKPAPFPSSSPSSSSYLEVDSAHPSFGSSSTSSSSLHSGSRRPHSAVSSGPSLSALSAPTSPSWKNLFRRNGGSSGAVHENVSPSFSVSRKFGRSKSALTLDTDFAASANKGAKRGQREDGSSSRSGYMSHNGNTAVSMTHSHSYSGSYNVSTKGTSTQLPSPGGHAAHGRSNGNGALTPSSSQSFNMSPSPLHASSPSGRYSSHSGSSSGGTLSSESGLGVVISGGHGFSSPLHTPASNTSQLSPNHTKNFQYQTYNGYSQGGGGGADEYSVEEGGFGVREDGTLTDGRRRKSSRSSTQPSTPGYSASFASMQQQQHHTGYITAQGASTHPARGVVVGPGMLPTPSSSRSGDDADVRDLRREKTQRSSKSQKVKVHDYGGGVSSHKAPLTPVHVENSYLSPGGLQAIPVTPSKSGSGMGRFLRRVASAPNAKGFFNLSKKDRDRGGDTTSPNSSGQRTPTSLKALLSPGLSKSTNVPPPLPENHAVNGFGEPDRTSDSLDTVSTSSSIGQQQRLQYNRQGSHPPPAYYNNHATQQPSPQSPLSVSSSSQSKRSSGLGAGLSQSGKAHRTLAHSQSAQHLHSLASSSQQSSGGGGFLSPPRGTRTTRALSIATPPKSLSSGKGGSAIASTFGATLSPPQAELTKPPFRRTYSSNSIKIRSIEVTANSFQKVKLLGRGDVGKVYLVREKKSGKLYAMKGTCLNSLELNISSFDANAHWYFIHLQSFRRKK